MNLTLAMKSPLNRKKSLADSQEEQEMTEFSQRELLGAMFSAQVIVLHGLIDQGAVDKSVLFRFIQTQIDHAGPEPLAPSIQMFLRKTMELIDSDGIPSPLLQ